MKKIIIPILIVVLIVLLFSINLIAVSKTKNKSETKTTTKKVIDDAISDVSIDKIMIEGMEEEIKVSKYSSHLGFSLKYDVEKFNTTLLSNGTVELTYIYNDKVKLRIEKYNSNDYYELLNSEIKEEVIDNNKYTYLYKNNDESYFRIVSVVPNYSEYADMYVRIDYTINSFEIL